MSAEDDAFAALVAGLGRRTRVVFLTAAVDATAVAILLSGHDVQVVPHPQIGAVVVHDVREDDPDLAELLGEVPASARDIAETLTQYLPVVMVMASRVGVAEDGVSGQMQAFRVRPGQEWESVSPGLLLAQADEMVEGLVFGTSEPEELPGTQPPPAAS